MLYSYKGLVVRENAIAGNARYINILTAEKGKISVLVRGSSGSRGRFGAPTQLFCYSEFILYEKGGKYTLNDVSLIENYFALSSDYDTLTLGSYILSAAEYVMPEEQPDPGILRLTLNTLWALTHKKSLDRRLIKGAFELRLAWLCGFAPDLTVCADCGAEPTESDGIYLNVMDGCLVCRDCMEKRQLGTHLENEHSPREIRVDDLRTAQIIIPLAKPVLLAMQYALWVDAAKLFSFTLTEEYIPPFSKACEKYLESHLEHHFPVLDMLDL